MKSWYEALCQRNAIQVLAEPNNVWVRYARAKYSFHSWRHRMRASNTSAYWDVLKISGLRIMKHMRGVVAELHST